MSTVEIFCTGTARSAHRKFVIETVTEVGGRWLVCVEREDDSGPSMDIVELAELVEADGRYPLRCGRCPKRNTRVTPDTLGKTLDKIVDAGLDWLDLRHSRF